VPQAVPLVHFPAYRYRPLCLHVHGPEQRAQLLGRMGWLGFLRQGLHFVDNLGFPGKKCRLFSLIIIIRRRRHTHHRLNATKHLYLL